MSKLSKRSKTNKKMSICSKGTLSDVDDHKDGIKHGGETPPKDGNRYLTNIFNNLKEDEFKEVNYKRKKKKVQLDKKTRELAAILFKNNRHQLVLKILDLMVQFQL